MSKKKKGRGPNNRILTLDEDRVMVTCLSRGIFSLKIRKKRYKERLAEIHSSDWKAAIDYFRGRCAYCLRKPEGSTEKRLTKDHFIPKCAGGKIKFNIIPACEECNHKKDNDHPENWCTEKQLERIYTYFWDARISRYGDRSKIEWKAIGI